MEVIRTPSLSRRKYVEGGSELLSRRAPGETRTLSVVVRRSQQARHRNGVEVANESGSKRGGAFGHGSGRGIALTGDMQRARRPARRPVARYREA